MNAAPPWRPTPRANEQIAPAARIARAIVDPPRRTSPRPAAPEIPAAVREYGAARGYNEAQIARLAAGLPALERSEVA